MQYFEVFFDSDYADTFGSQLGAILLTLHGVNARTKTGFTLDFPRMGVLNKTHKLDEHLFQQTQGVLRVFAEDTALVEYQVALETAPRHLRECYMLTPIKPVPETTTVASVRRIRTEGGKNRTVNTLRIPVKSLSTQQVFFIGINRHVTEGTCLRGNAYGLNGNAPVF